MSTADPKNPMQQIQSDEDWKSRVNEENARLDAERNANSSQRHFTGQADSPDQKAASSIDASQLPPAEFATMVSMFSTQAMFALGILPSPVDGKADRQLPLAKHFIDLLGVLEDKTRGNRSEEEDSMLGQTLHELRMAYVELRRQE